MRIYNLEIKQPRRIIAITFGIIMGAGLLYSFWHGTLAITSTNTGSYTYYRLTSNGIFDKISGNGNKTSLVRSGDYVINFSDSNGVTTKYLRVGNLFRKSSVSFDSNSQIHVEHVAGFTGQELAADNSGNSIFSTGTISQPNVLQYDSSAPFKPTSLSNLQDLDSTNGVIANNQLVSFSKDDESTAIPSIYNFANRSLTNIEHGYDREFGPIIIAPANANQNVFGVQYTQETQDYIDIFVDGQYLNSFNTTGSLRTGAGGAVSFTDKQVAVAYGNDAYADDNVKPLNTSQGEQDPKSAAKPRNFVVKIFDTHSKKEVRSIDLGPKVTYGKISLSPDASYIALGDGKTISVFDTVSKKRVFGIDLPDADNLSWLDTNNLIFNSTKVGIYDINAHERLGRTLFSSASLRISSLNIAGNRILFTAFPSAQAFASNDLPDAYIAYTNQPAIDKNVLIEKLPYRNDYFSIYAFRKTIYIGPRGPGSDDHKQSAIQYVRDNIPNTSQYKVIYGHAQ